MGEPQGGPVGTLITHRPLPPFVDGVCDGRGRLACRRCYEAGFGLGELRPIDSPPHRDEPCDFCADILANRGEP